MIRTHEKNPASEIRRKAGFTIIELLVVVSIIALLVSILVPTLSSARSAAKNSKSGVYLKTIQEGLVVFREENEKEHRQSNGFPSSRRREDPATEGNQDLMGAQWLVRALVGKDLQGYIPRRIVPPTMQDRKNTAAEQVRWYEPLSSDPPIDRIPPYISLERMQIADQVKEISRGTPDKSFWNWCIADCGTSNDAEKRISPVFVDAFGAPILYYAANTYGKELCAPKQGIKIRGNRPYYVHEDNEGFTGSTWNTDQAGWTFTSGGARFHPIREFGPSNYDFTKLDSKEYVESFATYIHDHRVGAHDEAGHEGEHKVVRPHNPDSYLLITAGRDLKYGTSDDVDNFER